MTNEIELRKFALEKAIAAFSNDPGTICEGAKNFYSFLKGQDKEPAIVADSDTKRTDRPVIFAAHDMTPARRNVLKAIIALHGRGEKVSGIKVAEACSISNGCASSHMRALIKSGHIKRQGNKFWPVIKPDGQPYVMPITKYPDGFARGYRPLTQKLGDIAPVAGGGNNLVALNGK